jgi:hypothetical protein
MLNTLNRTKTKKNKNKKVRQNMIPRNIESSNNNNIIPLFKKEYELSDKNSLCSYDDNINLNNIQLNKLNNLSHNQSKIIFNHPLIADKQNLQNPQNYKYVYDKPNFIIDYNDISSNSDVDPLIVTSQSQNRKKSIRKVLNTRSNSNINTNTNTYSNNIHPMEYTNINNYSNRNTNNISYQQSNNSMEYKQRSTYSTTRKQPQFFFPNSVTYVPEQEKLEESEIIYNTQHGQGYNESDNEIIDFREISNRNNNNNFKYNSSRDSTSGLGCNNLEYYYPYNIQQQNNYYNNSKIHSQVQTKSFDNFIQPNNISNNIKPQNINKDNKSTSTSIYNSPIVTAIPGPISLNMKIKLENKKNKK